MNCDSKSYSCFSLIFETPNISGVVRGLYFHVVQWLYEKIPKECMCNDLLFKIMFFKHYLKNYVLFISIDHSNLKRKSPRMIWKRKIINWDLEVYLWSMIIELSLCEFEKVTLFMNQNLSVSQTLLIKLLWRNYCLSKLWNLANLWCHHSLDGPNPF